MQPATYLMNSTKKEYIFVGAAYPAKTGEYLAILEKLSNWDLIHDIIYISHSTTTYDYKNVRDLVFKGENIEETSTLY